MCCHPFAHLIIDEAHTRGRGPLRASPSTPARLTSLTSSTASAVAAVSAVAIAGSLLEAMRAPRHSRTRCLPRQLATSLQSASARAQPLNDPFRLLAASCASAAPTERGDRRSPPYHPRHRVQPLWSESRLRGRKPGRAFNDLLSLLEDLRGLLEAGDQGLLNSRSPGSGGRRPLSDRCDLQRGLSQALLTRTRA